MNLHNNIIINSVLFISILTSIIFVFLPFFIKIPNNLFNASIEQNELKVHKDKSLYNLADLLLLPRIWGKGYYSDLHEEPSYRAAVNDYPDSFLAIYDGLRETPEEYIPNVENIQKAIDIYIKKNKLNMHFTELLNFVNNKDVLCIHLRSGDYGVISDDFKNIILKLQKEYKYTIILCGLHHNKSSQTLIDSIKQIFNETNGTNIFISIEEPDVHLSMARSCQNLLLHKNGFSVLMGFLFRGDKLYLSRKVLSTDWNWESPEGNEMWINYQKPENNQSKQIIHI